MNSLVQITIVLTALLLVENTDARKVDRLLCNIRCYSRFPTICASDGKTYHGFCELMRARCRSKTSIKFVKYGKCPTCQVKEPIRCAVPACFFPSCPAYPKATCVSFCACKSEYYYRRRRVNCSPTTRTNPCNLKFCGKDGICKVVKGKAVCVSKGAVCSLPKVVGPCKARFVRYYFNTITQKCEVFYYGGCRSNGNNFRTKKLCEDTCKPDQDVCSLPAVQGPCEAHIGRYFYNVTSSKCEKFYYGGCQGNKNNFKTIKDCEKNCKRSGNPCDLVFCGVNGRCKVMNGKAICTLSDPCLTVKCNASTTCGVENGQAFCRPDFCVLPSKTGRCRGRMPRYFYNKNTGKCERFIYGGCRGNKNNFQTRKECRKQCKRQVLANPCIATTCLVGTRCVVVNGKGRCIPVKPVPTVHPSCAAVSCLQGTTCVVRNGRPLCATTCSASRGCKQQGSFCNLASGICQCSRFCLAVHLPVCGSDGKIYGNKCHLDAAACRAKKTITTVPCYENSNNTATQQPAY